LHSTLYRQINPSKLWCSGNALINGKTNAARLHYDANFFSNWRGARKSSKKESNKSASFGVPARRDIGLFDNESERRFNVITFKKLHGPPYFILCE
jgi:hypothetical protein